MARNKAASVSATPWYNRAPGPKVPFMGIQQEVKISDPEFQQFITAANKRLVKNWMGELKYHFFNIPEDKRTYTEDDLNTWFGTENGKKHFNGWCEQLGKQGGDRTPEPGKDSGHFHGKAMDINYDMNPWCPLYLPEKKVMSNRSDDNNACGRIYDRALRMFVPLVTDETTDPHGILHFAHRYYRNHVDWTMTDSTNGEPPFSARQVYKFYQILNWSLRFYFDYLYSQISVPRNRTKIHAQLNGYNLHKDSVVASDDDFKNAIVNDLKKVSLPPTSEIFIESNNVSDKNRALFDELNVKYPFESKQRKIYRFTISTKEIVKTGVIAPEVITAMKKQIQEDHKILSSGMEWKGGSRDPCSGIFNFSYETFLSLTYLAEDMKNVRAFGAFNNTRATGDMQHFDYSYKSRIY